ncbi:hypothetical protein CP556_04410 [Natrinema sp. CBA1119]|uniref:DUF7109 family protein n=1 Tax=Natrinema sp. CBA1119 TaxID=1608465 RepID=UPI000BFA6016|nr:hypothetical protein [Natrinema sp. CBA1119]PGF15445.1 hypothetical protein CP556_04410 [Natrinema sp. CBA1119]
MDATADELAGVVDLFGGLTREELERALAEAAYRADGQAVDDGALETAIDEALESFALVRYDLAGRDETSTTADDEALLVPGPTAFPTVPEHAEDLPHILDVERRRPAREPLGEAARERFVAAADEAVTKGDAARLRTLLDVSYDIEAWAPVDLADERTRLEDTLEE